MTMFCLIEDAEYITFSLDDGKNPFTIDYTSDMAVYTLGSDYFAESKTLPRFIGLLNRVNRPTSGEIPISYQLWGIYP